MASFLLRFLRTRVRPLATMFAMAGLALVVLRLAQHGVPRLPSQIDPGVLVLFGPLLLLTLAIMAEAVLLVGRQTLPEDAVPAARAIAHWQDEDL